MIFFHNREFEKRKESLVTNVGDMLYTLALTS